MQKVVYLSGPMSNIAEYNYPRFNYWEKYWRGQGYKVINPAKQFWGITSLPWWVYIIFDIFVLHTRKPTHIFMLQGWEDSTGAQIEVLCANRMGCEIIYETYIPELE